MSIFNLNENRDIRKYDLILVRPPHVYEADLDIVIEIINEMANEATDKSEPNQKIFKDYLLSSEIYKIV
jgi:hypothetical protein